MIKSDNLLNLNFQDSIIVIPPFEVWRQYFAPQRLISAIYGKLSHWKFPRFKNWAIKRFIRLYDININEALETNPEAYACFHDFFIRKLDPSKRPLDLTSNSIVSPCDGTISQIGAIEQGTLIQAKGKKFSVNALLGNHSLANEFTHGKFATIYLAPKDYHRVHIPDLGTLKSVCYIPGKLFSVNPITTANIDNLFAQNERVVNFYDSPNGPFAVVLVGAMIVGSITTHSNGTLTSSRGKEIVQFDFFNTSEIKLNKGEEMGYFSLGSTVILLFTEKLCWEQALTQRTKVVVGQKMGHY
jgi:phosphatidylserine decarboxylase